MRLRSLLTGVALDGMLLVLILIAGVAMLSTTGVFDPRPTGQATIELRDGTILRTETMAEYDRAMALHRGRIARVEERFEGPTLARFPIAAVAMPFVLVLPYSLFMLRGSVRTLLVPTRRLVLLGIVSAGAIVALSELYELVFPTADAASSWYAEILGLERWSLPVALVVVVLGPLAEELYFRGRLFSLIESTVASSAALMVTSVIFALLHPVPVLWPVYVLIGLLLGSLRLRSGSLVPAIVAHVLTNGVAYGMSLRA